MSKQPPFSTIEARDIVDTAGSRGDSIRWALSFVAGVRQSEALALQWRHVDYDRGEVTIRQALLQPTKCRRGHHDGPVVGSTKTLASNRRLPMSDAMMTRLREHYDRQHELGKPVGENDWVFTRPDGEPVTHQADSHAWRTLLDQAGVRRVSTHDARRGAIDLLLEAGASAEAVNDVMGWTQRPSAAEPSTPAARAAIEQVSDLLGV